MIEHIALRALLKGLSLNSDTLCDVDKLAYFKVKLRSAERSKSIVTQGFELANKVVSRRLVAMVNKNFLRIILYTGQPLYKSVFISVTANSLKRANLSVNGDFVAKKSHRLCTVVNKSAQCAVSLIAYKQHRAFLTPEIIF